jgi:hypothetical protein
MEIQAFVRAVQEEFQGSPYVFSGMREVKSKSAPCAPSRH